MRLSSARSREGNLHNVHELLLVTVVIAAAVVDLRRRRIPNVLTIPALLAGWTLWLFTSPIRDFLLVVGVTIGVFAVGLLLFSAGILGGGDGKLLAAVAAIAGPPLLRECLIWTLIIGVIVSLVLLAARGALSSFLARVARAIADIAIYRHTPGPLIEGSGHQIAYGVVIAGGVIAAVIARRAGLALLS